MRLLGVNHYHSLLVVLNESNVSVNTPGKKEDSIIKMDPSFSDDLCQPFDNSVSPVHIVAAKNENKDAAVLRGRKIGGIYQTTVFNSSISDLLPLIFKMLNV